MVTFVTNYTNAGAVEERNSIGCLLDGVFLKGASWDLHSGRLCDQLPEQHFQPLPLLSVCVMESQHPKKHGTLSVPVYVTEARASDNGAGLQRPRTHVRI